MATICCVPLTHYNSEKLWQPVLVLEAPPGSARVDWMQGWLEECKENGARTFAVSCDFAAGGPWAGVTDLFGELIGEIQRERPDLIERHALELVYILPLLRQSVTVRNPNLTDLAPRSERTRNYPADRAMRNVHGLIDLLDEWKTGTAPEDSWVIACDSFDEAGAMGSLFFRELMRRHSERLKICLLASVMPGRSQATVESFDAKIETEMIVLRLSGQPSASADPDSAVREATALEQRIGDDEIELQANLPRLIQLWKCAGRASKVLDYQYQALETYNTLGLYADALRYADGLLTLVSQEAPDDDQWRWAIFIKILMCHLGLDDVEASLRLVEETGLPLAETNASWKNQLFYLMAMMYARFKKPRDFVKGEEYLERS